MLISDPMCGYLTSFLAGSIELVTNEEGLYDNNMLCVWTIQTPSPGLDIQIYVTKMDIETSQDCTLDYLQVLPSCLLLYLHTVWAPLSKEVSL